jgi:flagellar basal body-associated protein FliL
MAANDYYDFNPSPTTWALLLTVVVLFVLAISGAFIYLVSRGETSGPARRTEAEPPTGALEPSVPEAIEVNDLPVAKAS